MLFNFYLKDVLFSRANNTKLEASLILILIANPNVDIIGRAIPILEKILPEIDFIEATRTT